MWFPNRFDTHGVVQARKMARSLKVWIWKVDRDIYYPSIENKGHDDREAVLRLCFRMQIVGFLIMLLNRRLGR